MEKRVVFTYICVLFLLLASCAGNNEGKNSDIWEMQPVYGECDTVAIDTMDVGNPFIVYDRKSDFYYMAGDNGYVWKSKGLDVWVGPYNVLDYDTATWLGTSPVITSPEIHKFANKYYYMATFENSGNHSCTTLVADSITGPYRTIDSNSVLLDMNEKGAFPTFCIDDFDAGYMVYSRLGEQECEGTVQVVRYNDNFARRLGEAFEMFTASQIPWLQEYCEVEVPVLESPCVFNSGKNGLGILFVAGGSKGKAVGVAYSESGTLNGPWVVENEPLLDGCNSVSLFSDYDGTVVLVVDKDAVVGGVVKSVPELIKTDTQFDKLQIKGNYKF